MTTLTLSCDDFHAKLSAGLLSMLESEQLANVTIAVDGKFLKAHQMVLSICSSYFKTLLETNPSKHPIIFMKDVKYHIMKHLLRFMYEGETHIDSEDFQVFIETAQALQIKWLTTTTDQENQGNQNQEKNVNTVRRTPPEPVPEPPQNPSKTIKRPYKPERTTTEPAKHAKPVTNEEEPSVFINETATTSNFTEQTAKKAKISLEDILEPKVSHDDHDVQVEVEKESINIEKMPPASPVEIFNEGTTSGTDNRFFEHQLDETREFDNDFKYGDNDLKYGVSLVKQEINEIIDINDNDDDNEEGDELLEQLPDLHPGVLPDTSTSMQVSTLQEGESVNNKFAIAHNHCDCAWLKVNVEKLMSLTQKVTVQNVKLNHHINYIIHLCVELNKQNNLTIEEFKVYSESNDLEQFNHELADKEKMLELVVHFSKLGGKDLTGNVRNILRRLVANDLALQYNWRGRNDKKAFCLLQNILQLILSAVRRNPIYQHATQEEVNTVVKSWLRTACDRDGGRGRRK